MKITFLSATKTDTGANFLVEACRKKILGRLRYVARKV